ETVVFAADVNCFTVLDPAISRAFAPAIPPAIAPTAAPRGPISEPAAAPAAAPPTICKPGIAPPFLPEFFAFAIPFLLAANCPSCRTVFGTALQHLLGFWLPPPADRCGLSFP